MTKFELYDKLYQIIIGDLKPYLDGEDGEVVCNEEYDNRESMLGNIFFGICCKKPEMLTSVECTRVLVELVAP